ncbi:hypothetical protein PRK78_001453 [Emydomyces testavorans]|uniref:SET domain-containing protein n=1 Tax=Emydomyces testavorans TaxID=2070801 RepID=A0AAF0DD02_9EURO|nr:hypothetical protein PRK78_001453 [Emydomyces testavorans]
MLLLTAACVLLTSTLTSAGQPYVNSPYVCASAPLPLPLCQRLSLEERDSFSQASLASPVSSNSSSSPWASQPECHTFENTTQSFCVYSSHAFANSRGISILTTPDRAEYIQQLPAFIQPVALSGVNKQSSPPYEERQLPGKGRGLIANKTLYRGDRIFAHTPVLILDADADDFEYMDEKKWVKMENEATDRLPPRTRELFWELFGEPVLDPVADRINKNAFEIEIDEETHYAVFPEIARLNHDCRPNAAYFFDSVTLTHYVHAITTINPGTEITITYIDPHLPRRQRLRLLSSSWGFNCTCSLCSAHPRLTRESDSRLAQITALTQHYDEWETASSEMALTLISLYEQERLYVPLGSAYRFAALTFCAEGNRWGAIKYARLAIELETLDSGFRDPNVRLMKSLAEQPEKQSCWLKRSMRTEENAAKV